MDAQANRTTTAEECRAIGGHCYEHSSESLLSDPPQSRRVCKHCGHAQTGQQQPAFRWRDDSTSE